MRYNYVLLNEGFYRWLETNHLPIGSQILFLKLIHLFNVSSWSEWLAVDNRRMMALVQTKREQSVIEWRNKLLENNLIVYVKGKKGVPNKYKLNDKLTFINEAKSVVNSVVQSVVNSGVQSVAIDKQNKTKQNKNISLTTFEIYNNRNEHTLCDHICESTKSMCRRKSTYRINGKNYCNQHSKEILKNIEICSVSQPQSSKQAYGEFENVLLSEQELNKLKTRFGEESGKYIERLSNYIASSGKRYKSHYATILTWAEKDKQSEKLGGGNHADKGQQHSKNLCTEYPE